MPKASAPKAVSAYAARHPLVLETLVNNKWAVNQQTFEVILRAVNGEGDEIQAAEIRGERQSEYPRSMTMLPGGIAQITINGVMMPRATFFSEVSGLKSTAELIEDFAAAMDDPKVRGIAFLISSPGGAVEGVSELSDMIFKARGKKPIVAYARGMCCSGAYFVASAATKLYAAEQSDLGSVGVFMTHIEDNYDEENGIKRYEIVSSISPNKRATPTTAEGEQLYQTMVDDLAAIMVKNIARNRATTPEKVINAFENGFVVVGNKAVQAGMADATGTFEDVLTDLRAQIKQHEQGVFSMKDDEKIYSKAELDAAVAAATTSASATAKAEGHSEGVAAENARIAKIDAIRAPGYENIIAEHRMKPGMTAEAISGLILEAQANRMDKDKSDRAEDGKDLNNKAGGQGGKPGTGATDEEAADATFMNAFKQGANGDTK